MNAYDQGLGKNAANHVPLSPLTFLHKAAAVYPNRTAVIHGSLNRTWREVYARCRQLAHALQHAGIGNDDTVAAICSPGTSSARRPCRRSTTTKVGAAERRRRKSMMLMPITRSGRQKGSPRRAAPNVVVWPVRCVSACSLVTSTLPTLLMSKRAPPLNVNVSVAAM